jgi:hypothetical protein
MGKWKSLRPSIFDVQSKQEWKLFHFDKQS